MCFREKARMNTFVRNQEVATAAEKLQGRGESLRVFYSPSLFLLPFRSLFHTCREVTFRLPACSSIPFGGECDSPSSGARRRTARWPPGALRYGVALSGHKKGEPVRLAFFFASLLRGWYGPMKGIPAFAGMTSEFFSRPISTRGPPLSRGWRAMIPRQSSTSSSVDCDTILCSTSPGTSS